MRRDPRAGATAPGPGARDGARHERRGYGTPPGRVQRWAGPRRGSRQSVTREGPGRYREPGSGWSGAVRGGQRPDVDGSVGRRGGEVHLDRLTWEAEWGDAQERAGGGEGRPEGGGGENDVRCRPARLRRRIARGSPHAPRVPARTACPAHRYPACVRGSESGESCFDGLRIRLGFPVAGQCPLGAGQVRGPTPRDGLISPAPCSPRSHSRSRGRAWSWPGSGPGCVRRCARVR